MESERGVALVTGAGRGIGYAIAKALAARGFDVALASLEDEGPSLDPFKALGRRALYYRFDLADLDQHETLLDQVERDLGAPACLVNNAGVSSLVRGDLLDVTRESFDRCVAVNLRGTFFLTQAVAKRMLAAAPSERLRTIVTISSANVEIVGENRGDYCMTKSALAMMNKLFASRLADSGIASFEVRPGIVRTDMTAPAFERYDRFIKAGGVPMRRWTEAEEIGLAVATLACGGLPHTTGIHIDVGGGMQLYRV
jgi:NAD(P)-dependent dehydrogenase (short-subunit alcohol dehydrogenase family)